jgi:glyoxylase I family protein
MQSFPRITHVALTVTDLSRSVPWYQRLLGADPVLDEDTGPFRHAAFALGGTLLSLHWFPEGIDDEPFSPRRRGLDHVAFGCADRDELVAWARRLADMDVRHGGIVDAHYGSALSFKDPDGLPLEVFCPPGS